MVQRACDSHDVDNRSRLVIRNKAIEEDEESHLNQSTYAILICLISAEVKICDNKKFFCKI